MKKATQVSFKPSGSVCQFAERHRAESQKVDMPQQVRNDHPVDESADSWLALDCQQLCGGRAEAQRAINEFVKSTGYAVSRLENAREFARERSRYLYPDGIRLIENHVGRDARVCAQLALDADDQVRGWN